MTTFNLQWPQLTVIVMLALAFGLATAKHGQPLGKHSLWVQLARIIIWVTLLSCGGFFHPARATAATFVPTLHHER